VHNSYLGDKWGGGFSPPIPVSTEITFDGLWKETETEAFWSFVQNERLS